MRFILILVGLLLAPFALHAVEVSGNITLEHGFVVFRANSVESKYDPAMIPGMKTLDFRKKAIVSGNQEIDVSEVVLQTSDGKKVTLTMNKPEAITRITDGTSVRWVIKNNS